MTWRRRRGGQVPRRPSRKDLARQDAESESLETLEAGAEILAGLISPSKERTMPKGISKDEHRKFMSIVRELRSNGLADRVIAGALGYQSAAGLKAAMDEEGGSPPVKSKFDKLMAFASSRVVSESHIPKSLAEALVSVMAVWYFFDTAIEHGDMMPMMASGFETARDQAADLVEFLGGTIPTQEDEEEEAPDA